MGRWSKVYKLEDMLPEALQVLLFIAEYNMNPDVMQ